MEKKLKSLSVVIPCYNEQDVLEHSIKELIPLLEKWEGKIISDYQIVFTNNGSLDNTLNEMLKIKEKFNFKQSAKDVLITSQLRTALIFNKKIKSANYSIDTYKKKIYIYGIALTSEEKDLVISEATEILDVENVVASILLVEDLRIQKD